MRSLKPRLLPWLNPLLFAAVLAVALGGSSPARAQTIDLLPFVCPQCTGQAPVMNHQTNSECFRTTGGNGRFRITKSCNNPTNAYEDYSYDGSWLYHFDDTTWRVDKSGPFKDGVPKCPDGSIAYNTYVNYNTGNNGGHWYPRNMTVGTPTGNINFYVQPLSQRNGLACEVKDYAGQAGHNLKLVSIEWLNVNGNRRVARLAKIGGAGYGENYWYAEGVGWVAYDVLPAYGFAPDHQPWDFWSIGNRGAPGTRVWKVDGYAVSTTQFNGSPGCGRLGPGQGLMRGQQMRSCNGRNTFAFQTDGNLVAYGTQARWWTGTSGRSPAPASVYMQKDGNLVMYDVNHNKNRNSPVWASGTQGNGDARLDVQDDCNNVIYTWDGRPIWHTNSYPCN